MAKPKKIALGAYLRGIFTAAAMSFRIAPGAVGFKLAGSIFNAVLPIVTTYFAAKATTELAAAFGGDEAAGTRALMYIVISVLLGLFSVIWNGIDRYIQALLRYKVESIMSDTMYERFLSLEFWRYEDKATIDTYDKAQQFARFYAYVFDRLSSLVSQLITVVAAIVALVLFVPWIALIVLLALVPGMYFQFKLSRLQINHWNKNISIRRAQNFIEWNLLQPDAITELRVNGLVRHFLDLRNDYRERDERQRLNFERRYIGRGLISDSLESAAELISLVWITLQIIAKEQPIGQFVYVQQLVSRAIGSANSFISTLSGMDEEIAQLFDYQKFMEYPVSNSRPVTIRSAPAEIILRNVSFAYYGGEKPVLQNISIDIKAGSHIAIVGENGAGKSTLVKLLLGLYPPSKGEVMVDSHDLSAVNLESWHRFIAVLQQEFQHYDFASIRDNVYFGNVEDKRDKERYNMAIHDAEAGEFIEKLPSKDGTLPSKWMGDDDDNEKGTNLSGGQWQRLALARSFYRNAPIIVLDEPTSAIDALAESKIFRRLFAHKNKTIITISHRLNTVRHADIIYVLENGKLAESGTHDELIAKKSAYYHLFKSQLSD